MVATPNKLIVKDNAELIKKLRSGKKCVLEAESMKGEPIYLRSEIVTCAMFVSEADVEKARVDQEEREKNNPHPGRDPRLVVPRRPN